MHYELFRRCFELLQETDIVLEVEANVVGTVLKHGHAFDAKTEGETAVFGAVDTAVFQDVGSTMPQPRISTQPVCLQRLQPAPPQMLQETSISADGSVNGK